MGHLLIQSDVPEKADAVVVLAGDGYGNRVTRGAELVRQGYAPVAVVSGPEGLYGANECDLAISFAVRQGYPESYFECVGHEATSTREEAEAIVPALRARGVKRFLLVTSNFHTRRAGSLFRRAADGMEVTVVQAEDRFFDPDRWWQSREGRKTFVLESMKTVATWLGE